MLNNKESGFNLYSAVEKVVGEEYIDILWNGANDSVGVRTPYSFSGYIDADGDICGIKSICDYVSKEYTLANAKGNVTVILSDKTSVNKVFGQTELPTMLSKNDVEKINGIPKEVLLGLSPEEQINILKEKSVIDMMNANIYRGPDGTEILSFKGTKYENIFKTDITDDYTNVGRYADRAFLSHDQLFSKYLFLNSSVSQSILDEFRIGEYRLKTTGIDTLTNKNLYFDNNGLLLSIDKKVPDSSFETTIGDVRQFKSNAEMSKLFPDVDFEKLSELEKIQLRQLELEYRRANGILDIDKLFIINIIK